MDFDTMFARSLQPANRLVMATLDSHARDALWWPIVMNNAKAGQSGAGWILVACLLAIGALLGLSTNLAKLAGMHGLNPLPFLGWSLRDLLYGQAS